MKDNNNRPIQWHSNISQIEKNFHFHSLIKYTNNTQHYIVEDIQNFMQQFGVQNQQLFYLKQIFLTDEKEFLSQQKYYNNLFNYCQNVGIRRKDVCKLYKFYTYSDEQKSSFEIILIMEYGESDRIDVEQIENSHINKFLKNIIGFLQDLKKYSEISHNNLSIQNIVLVQDVLKISGFKPICMESDKNSWKQEIAKEYGVYRLDLFLLGLLWLQFKNFSIKELTKDEIPMQIIYQNIKNTFIDQMDSLRNIEGKEILIKLLDLNNNPKFDLEQLQLLQDSILLIKNIQNTEEELNPFKESLKSENVNSSYQNDSQIKNKMVINKDFSLKNNELVNFVKKPKDELISIQDLSENNTIEIYNEEKQLKEDGIQRMSVSNQNNKKQVVSSQYNSEKQFDNYKDQIQRIKQESLQKKNQNLPKLQQQSQQNKNDSKQSMNNIEESYKESLVNFPIDQQSQQKDQQALIQNNSSEIFQLQSEQSKKQNQLNSVQNQQDENKLQQKDSNKDKLLSYLDKEKKQEDQQKYSLKEQIIEEQNESNFNSKQKNLPQEEHINILNQFNKKDIIVQGSNEDNKEDDQDRGLKFFNLVNKAIEKKDQLQDYLQNEFQQQLEQDQEKETIKQEQTKEIDDNKNQNKQQTYTNILQKQKIKNKSKPKKTQVNTQKNLTNSISKPMNNKMSYKNYYQYQKRTKNQKQDLNLEQKIQNVLKKHQKQMLKTKRVLKKDEKLDKSLEQVKRKKNASQNSQLLEKKIQFVNPNQKMKNLVKNTKVSNVQDNKNYQTQTKTFENINQKLFESTPNKQISKLPITQKKKEIQNDYKSIRPMKQQKIKNIPFNSNPLVSGLPDIKQKDKLDKSSFDIKFDISLNKSRNYDSYIDCKYKSNNYRRNSKNLPTDNILKDVYQKQNTLGNETLNFSFDNSFINTMQDPNKTIQNIMENFEQNKTNISQQSQKKKPKKNAQFNLGEVQKLLNKSLVKSQQKQNISQNDSQEKSDNKSINKSQNRSLNKSQNNGNKNNSYIKKKETIQDKLKNDPEFLQMQFGKNYQQKMKTLAVLLKHQKLEEAIELLFYVLQTEIGQQKIDAYKQLGILFCYTNDLDKAVEYTIRGLEYQDNQNIKDQYIENKKALLMNLAIIYSRRKEYNNCLDILMDELFQNETNQPIAYMTILGDCHYSMQSYLNAFECYKEQIERLCQLLMNKDIYHNFILISKKAVASLIQGEEYQFFPQFVKFVLKCAKRFTTTQETYEGKAKFLKLQDKLICALIHVIWGKRSIQFMLFLKRYQYEKKLVNLKNLSAKEINILVDDILSYALQLKQSSQFKQYRDDFYIANDFILQAINSVDNQKPLQRQKVITLFNQGIFLIQERNFQLAKIHHQECLDILNQKSIKNEQQIFVILYNIGLSMYKMNDEKNCIYYLEQIFDRKCNNSEILSQALYFLILSYYKTSQYEKIIQYFDCELSQNYGANRDYDSDHFQIKIFLYLFANFRIRSGSIKQKLLDYQDQLKYDQNDLLYHIILANSKLMLKYFREKNLQKNIPLQEKLSNLLLNDKKEFQELMKIAKDFYFQNVEQVQIAECISEYGIKTQANFIVSFILQMINLLNFVCDKEYTLEQRRDLIKFIIETTKDDDFRSQIFSQSLKYNKNRESKHDLTFINQEISKLDTTQVLNSTQKVQVNQKQNFKKKSTPKNTNKTNKQKQLVNKDKTKEEVEQNIQLDKQFEELWLCSSKQTLDSYQQSILQTFQQKVKHNDKIKYLLELILTNNQKSNDKKIIANVKKLKLKNIEQNDNIKIVQAFLLKGDTNNLKIYLEKLQFENQQQIQQIIDTINSKFLINYNQIINLLKVQVFNGKQFYVENSVFYHLLPQQYKPQKQYIFIQSEFSILMVNFYKCLKLKSFNFIKNNLDNQQKQKYKIFNILYQFFIKGNSQDQHKLIEKMIDILNSTDLNEFENNIFIIYVLSNYCSNQSIEKIQLIEKLRTLFDTEDFDQKQIYIFVVITSLIGNVYFRNKMWMKSNKAKQLSFEGLKKLDFQNLEKFEFTSFPLYTKEYILFQIFSYWYMNEHKLGSNDLAKKCLLSMEKFQFEEENLKNQFSILKLYEDKFNNAGLNNQKMINFQDNGIINEILNNVQTYLVKQIN